MADKDHFMYLPRNASRGARSASGAEAAAILDWIEVGPDAAALSFVGAFQRVSVAGEKEGTGSPVPLQVFSQ
jgi:hypothetical protein